VPQSKQPSEKTAKNQIFLIIIFLTRRVLIMMTASVRIAKIWNIPIGLHWSWFIVFTLVTYSLAAGIFPRDYANLTTGAYWTLGAATSILFFASILLHELGHTFVALRYGVPVREINLFIFGGVAVLTRESPSAKAEFWIAIAGPIVSFALAGIFALLWIGSGDFLYLAIPAFFLAGINLTVAVFNMIPGFPLDGGRVLRAIVWGIKGDLHKATRFASATGQMVAFAFIGWFLQNAAAATLAHSNLERALRDVTVRDVMTAPIETVERGATLQEVVDERLLRGAGRCYFVVENNRQIGLITLTDITRTPREEWSRTTVEAAMTKAENLVTVAPQTGLLAALQRMDEAGVAQLPVIENDAPPGILSRETVLHQIYLRTMLGIGTREQRRSQKQPDFVLAGGEK
jgi:Zn-dependent protease/CBS domain-containing protein